MAAPSVATSWRNTDVHSMFRHPKQMKSYGFHDEEQLRLSLIVYLDLIESKGWWNVEIRPCHSLQKVLIAGHATRTDSREFVLAQGTEEPFTMARLQVMLKQMQLEHDAEGFLLALVESDSTTLYSRVTAGLVPPEPPEAQEEKLRQQKRKVRRRYQSFVQLSGLPDNSPQYALTSASRRAQEHGEDPSGVVKMAATDIDKGNTCDKDNSSYNDSVIDSAADRVQCLHEGKNVGSDSCEPGSSEEHVSGVR